MRRCCVERLARGSAPTRSAASRSRTRRAVDAAVARARAAFPRWRDAGLEARARRAASASRALARERADELARADRARGRQGALGRARRGAAARAEGRRRRSRDGMQLVAPIRGGAGRARHLSTRAACSRCSARSTSRRISRTATSCPALATGNTVVFKPSELAPAVGAWMAARWREAGLPERRARGRAGRRRHGPRARAPPGRRRRALHRLVRDGPRARAARRSTSPASSSRSSSAASNAMIVCADADLDLAVSEAALSIAATTGQRCTALSRIFVERPRARAPSRSGSRACSPACASARRSTRACSWVRSSRSAAHARLERCRALARRGRRRARAARSTRAGRRPSPAPGLVRFESTRADAIPISARRSSARRPRSTRSTTSTQAIAAANDSDYGLAASVMTRDRAQATSTASGGIRTGVLNWNRGTIGASGPAAVRRQRQERQRPARRRHRDALLHRAAGAPRERGGLRSRTRCRPGCRGRERGFELQRCAC